VTSFATFPLGSRFSARNGLFNFADSLLYSIPFNPRAMNPVVRGDISVSAFLDSVGGYRHKERRDKLLDLLDIDLDWRMHTISDGERRRVQLCFGLMTPWDVLLLDEVRLDFLS
jgi:ABC-type molybdenum transport system ATPase subunit/photorepair protein PhrA